jgi:hypothetical protein
MAPLPSHSGSGRGGDKLIEPAVVSNKKEDNTYFLDQEHSGL